MKPEIVKPCLISRLFHLVTGRSLEWFFGIDGDLFERQYKRHLSGYWEWKDTAEGLHAEQWRVFPENIGPHLSIDETSLSKWRALHDSH